MKIGDLVETPRFLKVRIDEMFETFEAACDQGYKEPTHYRDDKYDVLGKSADMYHMTFAAVRK